MRAVGRQAGVGSGGPHTVAVQLRLRRGARAAKHVEQGGTACSPAPHSRMQSHTHTERLAAAAPHLQRPRAQHPRLFVFREVARGDARPLCLGPLLPRLRPLLQNLNLLLPCRQAGEGIGGGGNTAMVRGCWWGACEMLTGRQRNWMQRAARARLKQV